jgi:outer membrane protein assembly factor BamB
MTRHALLAALLFCPIAGAQSFRADAAHSGVYNAPGPVKSHAVKWQFHTAAQIYSSPVISGGTVFFGGNDHFLYAVDLKSGSLKWKFETGARIPSTPAVSGGLVFFLSYDSNYYALDAESGALKWKFATGGERRFAARHIHGMEPAAETMPDPFDFFLSSPTVANGVVYFGSGDSNVYALDAASGAVKWKFKTGDVVHASPAVAEGTVYVGSWDTYLYALDAVTGAEKWRFKTGEDHEIFNQVGIQASPAIAEGTVFFGCRDSNFYALDAATGQQRWAYNNKGSWVIGSAAVRDGKVFFATSDTGLFHALDAASGKELFSLDFNHWPMFSSPAIAGNFLYIGSHRGRLHAIDLKSQKAVWSFETEASKANGPALTNEKGEPNHSAFTDSFYDDIFAGIRRTQSLGWILSSPAVAGGILVFTSTDGNLYALE